MAGAPSDRPIWEQMPHEIPKAYLAFCLYRNLGPRERTVRKAHELYRGMGVGSRKSAGLPPYFNRWSSDYRWVDRARAYDVWMLEEVRRVEEDKLRDRAGVWAQRFDAQREQEWLQAEALLDKVDQMLAFPISRTTTVHEGKGGKRTTIIVEPADWRLADVATIIKTASALGRLAIGEDQLPPGEKAGKKQVMMIGGVRVEF